MTPCFSHDFRTENFLLLGDVGTAEGQMCFGLVVSNDAKWWVRNSTNMKTYGDVNHVLYDSIWINHGNVDKVRGLTLWHGCTMVYYGVLWYITNCNWYMIVFFMVYARILFFIYTQFFWSYYKLHPLVYIYPLVI